mgnify:CR=1 FL=1
MIPRKRQAAPQAPARDFKPRKNGTPAVPATPPANMPSPAPAPQMQQPPMRGAAQSVGRAPQQEQRAPQRAPQRAQGRFNPMQGPMGADMDRARQAAATMFMDRAPKPMQPSMPQQPKTPPPAMPQAMPQGQMQSAAQSAMQRAPQEAPKPQQTSQPQDFSPAQKAAFDIADMGPGSMFIKFGAVPDADPPPDSGQMEISGDGVDPAPSTQEAILEEDDQQATPQGQQAAKAQELNTEREAALQADSIAFLEALGQGGSAAQGFANSYIEKYGIGGFVKSFGADAYLDIFGVTLNELEGLMQEESFFSNQAGEMDREESQAEFYAKQNMQQILSAMPPVDTGIDASALGVATPELMQSLLGVGDGSYDMENLDQNLVNAILGGLIGETEGLFTDDEMSAQAQALKKEADAAKQKLAMQMAMRGMGASGLAGAGFGNIDSKLVDAINELAISSKAQGAELGLNKAQIAASLFSALQSDDTRRFIATEALDYEKEQDALANAEIWMQHAAAFTGADSWSPASMGAAQEMLANGVPWWEISSRLGVTDGVVTFGLTPAEKQALIDKYADGASTVQPGTTSADGRMFQNPDGTFYLDLEGNFMDLDDLESLYKTDDPIVKSKVNKAIKTFENIKGGSIGPTGATWDALTDPAHPAYAEFSDSQRRELLSFVAQELGFSFAPPGVDYEQWHSMPENLRRDYWNKYADGKGPLWKPYGSSEFGPTTGQQQQQPAQQGDGQDAQGGPTQAEADEGPDF